jgi:hypothetical protein
VGSRSAQERAAWALSRACNGWRRNEQCLSATTGKPLPTPHPACIRAQEEHDEILREAAERERFDTPPSA